MEKVIIVLGHKNDQHGNLSSLSVARCQLALKALHSARDAKFICTGGFGENFNPTSTPHAHFNRQYLCAHGVDPAAFLPDTLSRFTIEDATLTLPVLSQLDSPDVSIISSEFHVPRVKLIFNTIMPTIKKSYLSAPSPLSAQALSQLEQHEVFAKQRDTHTLKAACAKFRTYTD